MISLNSENLLAELGDTPGVWKFLAKLSYSQALHSNVRGEIFRQQIMGCRLGKPLSQRGKCLDCHHGDLELHFFEQLISLSLEFE
jgi:hypothetical protein